VLHIAKYTTACNLAVPLVPLLVMPRVLLLAHQA